MASKCDECKGEGGWVVWLNDLGDQDFLPCSACGGRGVTEGVRGDAPQRKTQLPTRDAGQGVENAAANRGEMAAPPSGSPLGDPEPFDVAWERMERASEEQLRNEEQRR